MTAHVRVSGPPNSSYVIGYPGISATAVRETAQNSLLQQISQLFQACLWLSSSCESVLTQLVCAAAHRGQSRDKTESRIHRSHPRIISHNMSTTSRNHSSRRRVRDQASFRPAQGDRRYHRKRATPLPGPVRKGVR